MCKGKNENPNVYPPQGLMTGRGLGIYVFQIPARKQLKNEPATSKICLPLCSFRHSDTLTFEELDVGHAAVLGTRTLTLDSLCGGQCQCVWLNREYSTLLASWNFED